MIFGKGRVLFEKKKKGKKEKSLDVQMSGLFGKNIYFFSALNEDADKKDSGSGLQR